MAYSANKTTLSYRTGNSGSFTLIPNLREVPEFGGTPEKIDVTTLKDKSRRFIPGIKDHGELAFSFLYDNSTTGNYRTLKGLSERERAVTFQLTYPDGTAHEFRAIPAVKMDAGTINGALTFTATMLLQSGIEVTNEGGEIVEPVVLPAGVLKSRILTADDYTVEPSGAFRTETIKSDAFDSASEENGTHVPFWLEDFRYGAFRAGNSRDLTVSHPIVTCVMHNAASNSNTWRVEDLAIPTNAADISNIVFEGYTWNWTHIPTSTKTIHVEPYTAEGFHTFRVFGEFEADMREFGGDLNVIAYSIVIGARQNREGTAAAILFSCCCGEGVSGVRFELLSGTGEFMIQGIGMEAAAAENTFAQARRHFIAFKEPLAKGDRLSISALATTTRRRSEVLGESEERSTIISQPIAREFLRQGQTVQDSSFIKTTERSGGNVWRNDMNGIRMLTLSSEGLAIETGFIDRDWWGHYGGGFGDGTETTWDIDIEEIEVISRT